jgi:hypothetical protein
VGRKLAVKKLDAKAKINGIRGENQGIVEEEK